MQSQYWIHLSSVYWVVYEFIQYNHILNLKKKSKKQYYVFPFSVNKHVIGLLSYSLFTGSPKIQQSMIGVVPSRFIKTFKIWEFHLSLIIEQQKDIML